MDAQKRPFLRGYSRCSRCDIKSSLLAFSVALNLCLIWSSREALLLSVRLTWSRRAAEIAEAAASQNCSGHGYVFEDTFIDHNQTCAACECNQCFTGAHCSETLGNCQADADSGDPVFLEPFWLKNAETSATMVPGWYRMSYRIQDSKGKLFFSPELERLIRKIHGLVGNAVTDGKFIVLGAGSMQLVNAAVYSLSYPSSDAEEEVKKGPSFVVAPAPFYNVYKTQTEMFSSTSYKWAGDSRIWADHIKRGHTDSTRRFVEIVASPNNPTAILQNGVLQGETVKNISDRAYYWPHYTPITEAANDAVMLFSISKLTGHAGTRLGWAIVKDKEIYERMVNYVLLNTLGVSHDAQLRATTLLRSILESYASADIKDSQKLIFHYAYDLMRSRWESLEEIFKGSERFSLQSTGSAFCNFFGRGRGPSPAYAWVKCEREEDEDCAQVMKKEGGILGRSGEGFGWSKRFVRLTLLRREDTFQLLLRRLRPLLGSSSENVTALAVE